MIVTQLTSICGAWFEWMDGNGPYVFVFMWMCAGPQQRDHRQHQMEDSRAAQLSGRQCADICQWQYGESNTNCDGSQSYLSSAQVPNTPTALCENVAAIMTAFVFRTISYSSSYRLYCLLLPVLFVYYFSFINILNKLLFLRFQFSF